jgi:spermidine dehydrogenase
MTRVTDKALGMKADITRREFIQGSAVAVGASLASGLVAVDANSGQTLDGSTRLVDYPPTKTGLRGAHAGAYEVAHALAQDGARFPDPDVVDEHYDCVVVGAGISGLAAAHYYRQQFGAEARILLLENHDDFGGHAKRNEFHQSGQMVLSLGGTHNLEWWSFSDTVKRFMEEHGVDTVAMRDHMTFQYGRSAPNSPAMWFDRETYGEDRLLPQFNLSRKLTPEAIERIPISRVGRETLKRFYQSAPVLFSDKSETEIEALLSKMSYPDFLRQYGGLTEDAVQLFAKEEHGSWGLEMRAISATEALWEGYPGTHLFADDGWQGDSFGYPVAMWPDGNASLVRLMVARLMPHVAPDVHADNVAVASFDYSALDKATAAVRLRLNATAVGIENTEAGVTVDYVKEGRLCRVSSQHAVLACYHSIIPHLCPTLDGAQKEALRYQVKTPMLLTNVLIRNSSALDKLGVDAISCPGRLHARLFLFRGINTGGYESSEDDDGAVSLVFWGSISPPEDADDLKSQLRGSREKMLALTFDDFEREVRTVLHGLLGPAGFDVTEDILAITVNRWPHGYSYEYMQLWDPQWEPGKAPHEIARRPFGAIAIANSDAGASAYTHVAIDEAYRAISDLEGAG